MSPKNELLRTTDLDPAGHRASIKAMACLAGILSLFMMVGDAAAGPEQDSVDVEDTRATLSEWIETKRLISKEKKDWKLSREVLSDRIELVRREIEATRGKIRDAEESVSTADTKRVELMAEEERLKETAKLLEDLIAGYEQRTRTLLPRLPQHVRQHLKPITQELPEEGEETTLSLTKRYQNVVGILDQINKFNREVKVTSEVRDLGGGTKSEVTVIYLGIAYGFYVNGNEDVSGVGTGNETVWEWSPVNDIAPEVASAVRILNNEEVASFVPLPVEIK